MTFAFVHIPKTAGSAFWNVLTAHTNLRIAPHMLMMHYLSGEEKFQGEWDLYGGHTFYALLKEILPPNTQYMTILRNPINRIYSHWQYMMDRGVHIKYGFVDKVDFSSFIRDIRAIGIVSNFQARYLSHRPTLPILGPQLAYQIIIEQSDICSKKMRDKAIRNLAEFSLVGRQENFVKAIMKACLLIGVPPPFDVPVKYTDYRDQISQEDMQWLIDLNKIDMELWETCID